MKRGHYSTGPVQLHMELTISQLANVSRPVRGACSGPDHPPAPSNLLICLPLIWRPCLAPNTDLIIFQSALLFLIYRPRHSPFALHFVFRLHKSSAVRSLKELVVPHLKKILYKDFLEFDLHPDALMLHLTSANVLKVALQDVCMDLLANSS